MRDRVTMRPLKRSDASEWRRLRLEALLTCPTAFLTSHEDAKQQDTDSFAKHIPLPDQPSTLIGAFLDDNLYGSAGLHVSANPKIAHRGEIWGVYVAPELRGSGIGTALMRAVIAHARTRVSQLHLAVNTGNVPARRLYRALGFVSYGIEHAALRIDGVSYDHDLMVLTFDP